MIFGMTNKAALSIARSMSKANGLVLKEQNCHINGEQGYKLVDRKTGRVVMSNMTLHSVHYNFDHGVVDHHISLMNN